MKLVDTKLAGDIDEATYNDAFNDTKGKISAIKKDLERLKEDKAKSDDMKANVDSIALLIKAGNEITEFNRYLFECTVDKVVVGEGDEPYKVKFFLKTKQQYQISAQEYILNRKVKTVIDGIAYQHNGDDVEKETNKNESNAC